MGDEPFITICFNIQLLSPNLAAAPMSFIRHGHVTRIRPQELIAQKPDTPTCHISLVTRDEHVE